MTIKQEAYDSKASQEGWEMWQMLKLIKELHPKVIVEIGVDGGGFLQTLENVFKPNILIGIDLNKREELKKFDMIYDDSTRLETVDKLNEKLDGKEIDFLWIDGDHRYSTVKKDFELYSPLVRLGGAIGFHDTNNRGIDGVEVDLFLKELDEKYSFRHIDIRQFRMSPGTRVMWK